VRSTVDYCFSAPLFNHLHVPLEKLPLRLLQDDDRAQVSCLCTAAVGGVPQYVHALVVIEGLEFNDTIAHNFIHD
jgi:hypothetical protein